MEQCYPNEQEKQRHRRQSKKKHIDIIENVIIVNILVINDYIQITLETICFSEIKNNYQLEISSVTFLNCILD